MEGGVFWLGRERTEVPEGTLRLLSAREILEARREGLELAADGTEAALCANACLVAKALEKDGKPVYPDGRAVLAALRVEDIVRLAEKWGRFDWEFDPSLLDGTEQTEARKKAWSTRLMRAFSGVCSAASARCPRRSGPRP